MTWLTNITGLDVEGTYRSLNGAADESIFIGRASKAGFYLFFKVWRDMPYDAVLEYNRTLYRVEVKGTSGTSANVTRGGRSGAQINRDDDRTRVIERNDCDFVVVVSSTEGDCYIVPVDFIELLKRPSLSLSALRPFREKWILFMGGSAHMDLNQIRDGFMNLDIHRLRAIAHGLGITVPEGPISPPGTRGLQISDEKVKLVYMIWITLANS